MDVKKKVSFFEKENFLQSNIGIKKANTTLIMLQINFALSQLIFVNGIKIT